MFLSFPSSPVNPSRAVSALIRQLISVCELRQLRELHLPLPPQGPHLPTTLHSHTYHHPKPLL